MEGDEGIFAQNLEKLAIFPESIIGSDDENKYQ